MSLWLEIERAGPLATVQDHGRFGALRHGVAASGPMDAAAFDAAAALLPGAGSAGIEITSLGLDFAVGGEGSLTMGCAGGLFGLSVNGMAKNWPGRVELASGDKVEIRPGPSGNYGYLRFDREIDVPLVLGSRATNCTVGLGGHEGRTLRAGDRLGLAEPGGLPPQAQNEGLAGGEGAIRVIWGVHADLFAKEVRTRFLSEAFAVSARLDRMGVQLVDRAGVFSGQPMLSLVSEAVVPGDIQILGNGTPIVLMRDHQPTGGYPRIATIASVDLNRFAQMRPGTEIAFTSVTPQHAIALKRRQSRP